ncbi:MAG: hypothetical protein K6F79_05425 [Saccharofermentans sp.]|nr:hypothetical protein [Saccharofermentans sp.]
MTRNEYLKTPEQSVNRKNILSCAICGYVVAGISLVINLFFLGNYMGIIDSIFIVVMALLIQLLQSRVAAILLAVYSIVNMIMTSIQMGRLGGWWIAIIGGYSVYYTFKFQKAWKEFKNSNSAYLQE